MSVAIIYRITNTINGKRYIGFTKKPLHERWYRHCYNAFHGSMTRFHKAIRKYGKDVFIVENVIQDEDDLWCHKIVEPFLISYYETTNPRMGYNTAVGGEGGDISTSESWKESMKNYWESRDPGVCASYGMLGKHHSEESRKKIGKSNSCSVSCDGKIFESIQEAENYYRSIGSPKSVRKRIDSPKYPTWFRLSRKKQHHDSP